MLIDGRCPPIDQLSSWLDGRVEDAEMAELEAHLESCVACQSNVKTLTSSDDLVEILRIDDDESEREHANFTELLLRLKQIPQTPPAYFHDTQGAPGESNPTCIEHFPFLSPPESDGELGRLGNYRVLRVLGQGGMGTVFSAEDTRLGRAVALKVMLRRLTVDPTSKQRFLREARAAASLKSDHIVAIYEVGECAGTPFLAMERLEGLALDSALRSRTFDVYDILHIARDTALGLAEAHSKGLIHRDIKPANLWLEDTSEGHFRVKILDFGLARMELDDTHLTHSGAIVGTPAFMAPEQARNQLATTSRSDLFSLGCVLYLLCTGEVPFKSDTTLGALTALAVETPPAPKVLNPNIPASLSQLVMHLLEKEPENRPASARDVSQILMQIELTPDQSLANDPASPIKAFTSNDQLPLSTSHWPGAWLTTICALVGIATICWLWRSSIFPDVGAGMPRPGTQIDALNSSADREPADNLNSPTAAEQFDHIVKQLRLLNPNFDGQVTPTFENHQLVGLSFRTDSIDDISALQSARHLRALTMAGDYKENSGLKDLSPLNGLPLKRLMIDGNRKLSDLTPLQGMPLVRLDASGTAVSDLTPLSGMPLMYLSLWGWPGTDLRPLNGLPLEHLNIGGNGKAIDLSPLANSPLEFLCINVSAVSDITPLAGVPLQTFMCENTLVADLSPLRDAPLKDLIVWQSKVTDISILRGKSLVWIDFEFDQARDMELVKSITTLERINDQPAEAFWQEFAGGEQLPTTPADFTNQLGMQFQLVPKGRSWSSEGQVIDMPADFYLGRFEVTQAEFELILGKRPSWFMQGSDGHNSLRGIDQKIIERFPVERVSWTMCQEFVNKLNELDPSSEWVYRLPTRDEWRYACRGGPLNEPAEAKHQFYLDKANDSLQPSQANFKHTQFRNRTCRVGLFQPNALGLYDMHGNVWEWTQDLSIHKQPASRWIQGGGWNDVPDSCGVEDVLDPTEAWTYYDLGFRVARVRQDSNR